MDVGRLIRSAMGETAGTDVKSVELKPGQIVRGIVLQMLADNEALLQVGGVPLRARLDGSATIGQAALFQVQSDVAGGHLAMVRPLPASAAELPAETASDALRNLGMKDTAVHRAIVKHLHEEGLPLTRATAGAVAEAIAPHAAEGDAEPWIRAAAIALKRGLPVTGDAVRALHAATNGPAPSELLGALESAAREAMDAPGTSAAAKRMASGLLDLLRRADTLLLKALQPASPSGVGAPGAGGSAGAASGAASGASPGSTPAGAPPAPAAPPGSASSAGAPSIVGAPSTQPGAGTNGLGGGAASRPEHVQPSDERAAGRFSGGAASSASANVPPSNEEGPPLLGFMKLLGLDVEREWRKLAAASPQAASEEAPIRDIEEHADDRAAVRAPRSAGEPAPLPANPSPAAPDQAQAERAPLDTLKTALAQLSAADDVPPALKEAAQNALQSITGQQLLLAQDRAAPFAHVTMFIPIPGQNGGKGGNAAVHIQTRRGRKGELDAENCRLWFQLSLAALGETWVDVTIVNKILGLHVWNDHPAAMTLLDRHRPQMESTLRELGYQLLAFKHSPKPKAPSDTEAGGAGGAAKTGAAPAAVSAYSPNRYKGVDVRI